MAHIAHVAGAFMGYVFVKRQTWSKSLNPFNGFFAKRKIDKNIRDEEYADVLFAKIADEGIASLSDTERGFLDEYSRSKRGN